MNAPFPIDPVLTGIAIAYRNRRMIADQVLPRVPVGKQEFKYWLMTKEEGFTVPDTKVGRKSAPNEVDFTASEATDSTQDYGLDDPVPQADIENAPENHDPEAQAVEGLTDLILLDREVRTAALVFAAANYPAANKQQLSGATQWSDVTSDPIGTISDALDTPLMRPNVGVFGRSTLSKLVRHPDIVKAMHGNSGDSGIATRRFLADLFELDDIYVGEGFVNTAHKGQTPVYVRVWGKHASFLFRDTLANTQRGTTFGFTAQWGDRVSGSMPDPKIGLRGGQRVRVGESVKELVTAADLGYFFEDAVA